jgi:hypothetical protein
LHPTTLGEEEQPEIGEHRLSGEGLRTGRGVGQSWKALTMRCTMSRVDGHVRLTGFLNLKRETFNIRGGYIVLLTASTNSGITNADPKIKQAEAGEDPCLHGWPWKRGASQRELLI